MYKRRVIYEFEVDETIYAIIEWNDFGLVIEETRKNGQEDSHAKAWLVESEGKWVYETETISYATSKWHAQEVLGYLNANPFQPQED